MAKGYRGASPMGGGVNMNMIKQAQKMQQDMLKLQQEIEQREFQASAGGGMVTATVNGKRELLKLEIDPDAIIDAQEPEDAEMIADAVMAAVNEAMKKAADEMAAGMNKFTGGLNLGF